MDQEAILTSILESFRKSLPLLAQHFQSRKAERRKSLMNGLAFGTAELVRMETAMTIEALYTHGNPSTSYQVRTRKNQFSIGTIRIFTFLLCLQIFENTVPQRQRALQADTRPVYQRMPRSRLYMGLFMTLFGVGIYGTTVGFYNMAWGKKRSSDN
ncbi:hypothetical protein IE53DRAFT_380043 [Violaceomyces palustris]|uniref:Uncharacterized protein n=1 Tax=Violaceomyces palustris TaxID=1673888 RepID=A0ACD0NW76_9BASI|nr:hypothetical protein IE53DRAFT_380043 [Violaceomyces palustris]